MPTYLPEPRKTFLDTTWRNGTVGGDPNVDTLMVARAASANQPVGTQVIAYNGIEFPPATKNEATFKPLYDPSGFKRIGTQLDFTSEFFLVGGPSNYVTSPITGKSGLPSQATTDAQLKIARQRLNEPGGLLVIQLEGLGLQAIGSAATFPGQPIFGVDDIEYWADIQGGPKPEELAWHPLSIHACRVVWKVTAVIHDCENFGGNFVAFTNSVSTVVTTEGLTIRTIRGEYRVPLYASGFVLADQHHARIDALYPRIPKFERHLELNREPSGGTITFTIVDTELASASPFFPGIVQQTADLEVSSGLPITGGRGGFSTWYGSLNFSATMGNGVSKVWGWVAFWALLRHIYTQARATDGIAKTINNLGDGNESDDFKVTFFLTNLKFQDSIYDKRLQCAASFVVATSLRFLLSATGMYAPYKPNSARITGETGEGSPPAVSWDRWSVSMHAIQRTAGQHNLVTQNEYVVISVCNDPATMGSTPAIQDHVEPNTDDHKSQVLPNQDAETEQYYKYDLSTSLHSDERTFAATPVVDMNPTQENYNFGSGSETSANRSPQQRIIDEGLVDTAGDRRARPVPINADDAAVSSVPRQTIRKTGRTRYYLVLEGDLIRIGAYPVVPEVEKVGKRLVTKVGTDVVNSQIIGYGMTVSDTAPEYLGDQTTAIIRTRFRKHYILHDDPADFTVSGPNGFNDLIPDGRVIA